MNRIILISIVLMSFVACTPSYHYEEVTRFENSNWNKFKEIKVQIPVEAGKSYTFDGIILTDSSFKMRKIDIGFYLYLPGGENRLADHSIRILDYEYQHIGEITDSGNKTIAKLKNNLSISESGTLDVTISLHSQYLDNLGIIGFDLFVYEN